MAKIELKADLVKGSNYKYHLVDYQGTDIVIDATTGHITSTTTDFTAETEVAGVVKRAVEVGDVLTVAHTTNASNEGATGTVTAVAANDITITWDGTPVNESAGADINITAFKKTFQFLEAGALSFIDGVQGITWASQTVDDWDANDYDRYPRIFTSIEPRAKSVAALNGWEPHDNDTLKAIRDTALEIRPDANTAATQKYALMRSGNLHESTDQMYIWSNNDAEMTAPTAAVTTGYINELVLIEDTVNAVDDKGIWNYRCLEPRKTHLQGTVDMQHAEIYPVESGNGIDPKLGDGAGQFVSDATVVTGIYVPIDVNVDVDEQYDGDVDSVLRSFVGYVDANSEDNVDVHTKVHYLLRQPININADGTGPDIRGDKTPPITSFLGENMTVDQYYLLNYNTAQRNDLTLIDDTGNTQVWPKINSITVTAPSLAVGGTFSLIHLDTYGASNPTYLQNDTAVNQQDITIASSVVVVVAYSTYNVDGHTANTPLDLVLTWNRPGFIEPDFNPNVTLAGNDLTVPITPTQDPSYSAT